jgi:hypothetical protein
MVDDDMTIISILAIWSPDLKSYFKMTRGNALLAETFIKSR